MSRLWDDVRNFVNIGVINLEIQTSLIKMKRAMKRKGLHFLDNIDAGTGRPT
jgi:hypothetical protein